MKPRERESAIVNRIMERLKGVECGWFFKVHGGAFQAAGIPDVVGCLCGRFIALEVKRPGGRPTRLQEWVLDRIRRAGGVAAVVYSLDEAEAIIKAEGRESRKVDGEWKDICPERQECERL